MKRNELVKLASANGIAKANNVKSVVLEAQLKEMGIIKTPGKKTGRKIDPTSARQKRLAELEAKRANGELKRGRPVDNNSSRQIRLMELEAKRKNGEFKLGRAINPQSQRQIRLKELEAKRANGELKRGRPAKSKSEEISLIKMLEDTLVTTSSK